MKEPVKFEMDGWRLGRRRLLHRWTRLISKLYRKEFFLRCEMKLSVLFLFAALTAGAQSTTEHLPVTDAEKMADALRAAPHFITEGATIVDYPASKGGEFRVLRQVLVNGPAYRVHHPAPSMTTRDVSIEFSFSG